MHIEAIALRHLSTRLWGSRATPWVLVGFPQNCQVWMVPHE